MVTDSLKWWQILLPVLWLAIAGAGLVALLRRPRGHEPPERTSRRRLAAGAAILVAVVGHLATRGLTTPKEAPLPSPQPTRFDETSFESAEAPGVKLVAPQGWRVSFDRDKGVVRVARGSGPPESAPVHLQIESARLKEPANVEHLLDLSTEIWIANGLTPSDRFDREVDRRPGRGTALAVEGLDRSIATILVKRTEHIVTTLHCFVAGTDDPKTACDPVIDALEFLEPAF